MRSFLRTATITILMGLIHPAHAKRPAPSAWVAAAMSYPVYTTGKSLTPAAMTSASVLLPVSEHWSLVGKIAAVTPLTTVQLAPQFQIGIAVAIGSIFRLAASGLYRYIPHWSDLPSDGHVVGGSLAPLIALPSGIALGFPMAITDNLTTQVVSFSCAFEVLWRLPL